MVTKVKERSTEGVAFEKNDNFFEFIFKILNEKNVFNI